MYHHQFSAPNSRKFRRLIYLAIAVFLISGLLYWNYRNDVYSSIDPFDTGKTSVVIKKGDSISEIANKLAEKDLIKSKLAFYLHVKYNNLDKNIFAGRFYLNKSMSIAQISTDLTDAKKAEFLITIQEGLQITDIDQKLVDLGLIKSGEFIQAVKDFNGWQYYSFLDQKTLKNLNLPLEGYLYPDTYYLDPGSFKPHKLIYLALDNFEKKTADLLPQLKKHTVHQIVTMAAIIEKEVFGAENRKIVSGILWKRLEAGWMLGADATLLYTKADHKITSADLASDNPYNTRKVAGLPPGPISNPSLESIEAAMFPKDSPYWFYLTEPKNGEVIYAKTNEEHNANRAKYLN